MVGVGVIGFVVAMGFVSCGCSFVCTLTFACGCGGDRKACRLTQVEACCLAGLSSRHRWLPGGRSPPSCPNISLPCHALPCTVLLLVLQLYTHHVLAQLAGDVEEAAGQAAKRARTLPSFWAAKAALERQQRMQAGRRLEAARMRQPVGGEDERMGEGGPQGGPEEEGEAREEEEEGEGQARAGKRRRTASAAAKQQQQQQQHGGHQEEEDESLSDFK